MSYDRSMKTRIVFLLLLPVLLLGCTTVSPPARFYMLSPLAQPQAMRVPEMLVGVGPVKLADYLDRNQLVSRTSEVDLKLDEFNRWAGGLDRNITQVVAENLSRLMTIDGVLAYPWSSAIELDYQIMLDISRFDAGPGDEVILAVQWQLFDQRRRRLVEVQRGHFQVEVRGADQQAVVRAQSEALVQLSEALAQAIESAVSGE